MAVDPTDPHRVIGTVDLPTAASTFGSGAAWLFEDLTVQAPVDVRPPARSLQMTPDQMDSRRACPAAR